MDAERTRPWIIVGGGLAAGRAATTLRDEGFDGRLIVITAEDHNPYERPPLSKDYLRGETPADKLQAAEPAFWTSPGTELRKGRRVVDLDASGHRIGLDDGTRLDYGKLLIATGSSPIRFDAPGASLDFVHLVRTIDDSDRLRADAANAQTIAVAGGGWIAAEVAASLRQLGHDVTLIVSGHEVLERHLGPEVGAIYSTTHENHGVKLIRGARVVEVADGPRRGLRLSTGELVPADLVVLGFGATPNVDLARAAGLAVSNGIVADQELRASAPDVFVAGDVASSWHPRYGKNVRVEHWDNARQQGRVAALNMLDRATPYDRVPYFYSDQFDLGMETFGIPGDGELVLRRLLHGGFDAFWLADGKVEAAVHGNDWDNSKILRRLVHERVAIDRERLADPNIPLSELAPAQQPA